MNGFETNEETSAEPLVRTLSKAQRRVLGVLIEKGLTVPESYPLTLKAATSGCNQKSNRDPVTSYSEDQVLDALDELREMGLVVVVHTESGRTERYRHMCRKRFPFSEPQLGIVAELLLRGRQQLGELRARASRMVAIESLQDLRAELDGLIEQNFVQSNDSLERRGVEVDHTFYQESESRSWGSSPARADANESAVAASSGSQSNAQVTISSQELQALRAEHQAFQAELESIRSALSELQDDMQELRRSLGA